MTELYTIVQKYGVNKMSFFLYIFIYLFERNVYYFQ